LNETGVALRAGLSVAAVITIATTTQIRDGIVVISDPSLVNVIFSADHQVSNRRNSDGGTVRFADGFRSHNRSLRRARLR
jgi:hypothetical protein